MYIIDICYQDKTINKRSHAMPRVGDHIEITHIDQKLLSPDNADFMLPDTLLVTKVILIMDGDVETFDAKIFVDIPDTD